MIGWATIVEAVQSFPVVTAALDVSILRNNYVHKRNRQTDLIVQEMAWPSALDTSPLKPCSQSTQATNAPTFYSSRSSFHYIAAGGGLC